MTKSKRFFFGFCLLFSVGVIAWQIQRQSSIHSNVPLARVTTVAKVPFGNSTGQIKILMMAEHFTPTKVAGFGKYWPGAAVDDIGNVYMTDDFSPGPMNLFIFTSTGKLSQRIKCPWTTGVTQFAHGPGRLLWLADYHDPTSRSSEKWRTLTSRERWRVIKAQDDGTPLWEIGQRRERRSDEWHPVQPSAQRKFNAPLPHPPNYKPTEDKFVEIDALFAADNGDVFVFASEGLLRRFDSNGRFLALYDFNSQDYYVNKNPDLTPASFSLIAARDGTVYSHLYGTRDKQGWITTLNLEVWKSPKNMTTRVVDLSGLGQVGYGGIMLRGCDAKGNLCFLYRYNLDPNADGKSSNRSTALAIARVGDDNKAIKVFDIAEHYEDILKYAKLQVSTSKDRYHRAGIGDITHVSANGDIYLEVADATHIRIDKISFK